MRSIYLPALDRRVSLAAYVAAVKKAKANPAATFSCGLTCWWPCTGADILGQFAEGMHTRINEAIPYAQRGISITVEASA